MQEVKEKKEEINKTESDDDSCTSVDFADSPMIPSTPPTFHPPSFGLTTLGNSHGFDKSGSVSGYVLWINGRGIMIDPPPYSSATLEREGIRPRTIVGIILTHCHADHDAGAFQKVLTGSPVVVITTPTIYKSFIRKYAALASLSPSLLRHSHRYKPAIIGEPLRFQGATFHFTYSLHVIPCVGFRVEWRGRSMVFTGDHMNKPDELDRLQNEVSLCFRMFIQKIDFEIAVSNHDGYRESFRKHAQTTFETSHYKRQTYYSTKQAPHRFTPRLRFS